MSSRSSTFVVLAWRHWLQAAEDAAEGLPQPQHGDPEEPGRRPHGDRRGQARLSSVEARLAKLDEQIAAMREQAEADLARERAAHPGQPSKKRRRRLLLLPRRRSVRYDAARREIQNYAAELAIEQAARKLVVTAETDRLLVESFARRLGAREARTNGRRRPEICPRSGRCRLRPEAGCRSTRSGQLNDFADTLEASASCARCCRIRRSPSRRS